ncbi:DUF4258 domain-containing protein [bacterium]|nr:DUF4258 domain-containing protein [bacterium]
MSGTYKKIITLIKKGEIFISDHGYDEMIEDNIFIKDIISNIEDSSLIEDYPDYPKGPCILLLQFDNQKKPIHVVWGIPKGKSSPAVIVTAYRPDPNLWSNDFRRRIK